MNQWPTGLTEDLIRFYGNPCAGNGQADPQWEAENLILIPAPYSMVLSWNTAAPITHIRCHKRVAVSLGKVLTRIAQEISPADRTKYQLDRFGGCYNFRAQRGASQLSVHAFGAAIDFAPDLNPLGAEYGSRPNMFPMQAVQIFADEGWVWGGRWRRPDAMHNQAAKA